MTPIYDTVTVGGISGVPVAKLKCSYKFNKPVHEDYVLQYKCPQYGTNIYTPFAETDKEITGVVYYIEKNIPCGFPLTLNFKDPTAANSFSFNMKEDTEYERSDAVISVLCSATLNTQNSGSSSITYVSGMQMAPGSSTVNGTTDPGGAGQTRETGDAETAPKHKFVRYLIRARP